MPTLTVNEAADFAAGLRRRGLKVVMTNGVFDLLHPGHVRYLQAARREGDALIVALNSDRSVRANKGPARPITVEHERAELLQALSAVDAVVIFDEETPAAVIRAIQPDVLVKGADWAADQIVGRDTVEARGGKVVRIPVEQGWSTSAIVERIDRRSSLSDDGSVFLAFRSVLVGRGARRPQPPVGSSQDHDRSHGFMRARRAGSTGRADRSTDTDVEQVTADARFSQCHRGRLGTRRREARPAVPLTGGRSVSRPEPAPGGGVDARPRPVRPGDGWREARGAVCAGAASAIERSRAFRGRGPHDRPGIGDLAG
jgi:D-beta-D-heptose 7-phosphate kinase/D-beta-D-heptose 1-phosphate adenosyltransferase